MAHQPSASKLNHITTLSSHAVYNSANYFPRIGMSSTKQMVVLQIEYNGVGVHAGLVLIKLLHKLTYREEVG